MTLTNLVTGKIYDNFYNHYMKGNKLFLFFHIEQDDLISFKNKMTEENYSQLRVENIELNTIELLEGYQTLVRICRFIETTAEISLGQFDMFFIELLKE